MTSCPSSCSLSSGSVDVTSARSWRTIGCTAGAWRLIQLSIASSTITPLLAADNRTVAVLGAPIGRGRTAEVFAWGDGRVLKLFYAGAPETSVERETAAAAAVTAAGLPAPRFFGREDVDGRAGLVFERADGPSLLTTLSKQPWRALELAASFAQLHASIHAASAELPSQRGYLRRQIERVDGLPDALLRRTLDVLDRLPDGLSACHFDFHPDNVVLTARGPIVLDWVTGVRGV